MLKSALFHPFPASRRHVIRVDMLVLVDVIRVVFWMETFTECLFAGTTIQLQEYSASCPEGNSKFRSSESKLTIKVPAARIAGGRCGFGLGFALLPHACHLPQQRNECGGRHRQSAIPAIGQSELAKQLDILQIDQLHTPGIDFVTRERHAD